MAEYRLECGKFALYSDDSDGACWLSVGHDGPHTDGAVWFTDDQRVVAEPENGGEVASG